MKSNNGIVIVLGFLLGAVSWGIVALVSDRFEPFDSSSGFYIGQALLSVFALAIAYRSGIRRLFFFLLGAYVGMNTYAYAFGTSEHRAWFLLALITTLSLLVYPLVVGIVGHLSKIIVSKFRARNTYSAQPRASAERATGGSGGIVP